MKAEVADESLYLSMEEVNDKVRTYICEQKNANARLLNLALAFAKYDRMGCPSNWEKDKNYEHEEYISKWATDSLERMKDTRYQDIMDQYNKGLIPDVFSEFIHYD